MVKTHLSQETTFDCHQTDGLNQIMCSVTLKTKSHSPKFSVVHSSPRHSPTEIDIDAFCFRYTSLFVLALLCGVENKTQSPLPPAGRDDKRGFKRYPPYTRDQPLSEPEYHYPQLIKKIRLILQSEWVASEVMGKLLEHDVA